MNIRVERCLGGGNRYYSRISLPNGAREYVHAKDGEWTRAVATEALDKLESVYGFKRKNIRFV